MAISLGSIFGDVRLRLDTLAADAAAVKEAMAGIGDSVKVGMDEVATATEEGSAAAGDATLSLGDRFKAFFEETVAGLSDFAAQMRDQLAQVGESEAAAGEATGGFGEAIGGLGERLQEGVGRLGEMGLKMLEFQAIMGAMEGVQKFAGNLIGMNAEFEKLHAQLTSITGSSGSADKIMAWIKQFGQQVPDTTEHLAQATVTIQSLGLNAMKIVPDIANVAAAMGTDLPTAARAFSDAYEGRFMMMQNDLHVTKKQLEEFGLQVDKTGHVKSMDSLITSFHKLSEAKFGHGIENQMQTLNGQLSNLTDRLQFFAMSMGKPLFDMAKEGLGALFGFLDSHKKQVDAFADAAGKVAAGALHDLGQAALGAFKFLQGLATSLQPAVGPVANFITGQLIPAFRGLAEWAEQHLLPAIQQFANWAAIHVVPILVALGTVIATQVMPAVENLGTIILTKLVPAYEHLWTQIGPVLIPIFQFLGWLLANVVGPALGLLITGIAKLIDITAGVIDWLKHLGDHFAWLGNKAHEEFEKVKKAVTDALTAVGTFILGKINDIKAKWTEFTTGIHNTIHDAFEQIKQTVQTAINTVVGWFDWLYNHNYYFKALVDEIHKEIQRAHDIIVAIWTTVSNWLKQKWTDIQKDVEAAWKWVHDHIVKPVQDASQAVQDKFNDLKAKVKALWDDVVADAKALWSKIQDAFSGGVTSTKNYVNDNYIKPLEQMFDLGAKAFEWGKNLLKMFADGLGSMKDYLVNQAKNALGGLAKILGFHSPAEEGPGKDADTWAPNLMKMMADGIDSSRPHVEAAATRAASAIRAALSGNGAGLDLSGLSGAGGLNLAGLSAGNSNSTQQTTLNLTLEVTHEAGDSDLTPEDAGEQFGRRAGAALLTALAQRGHN